MPSDAAEAGAKIQILKDALYDEARQHGSADRLFTQKDLLDLNVIPSNDVVLLLRVVQSLTDDKLFVGGTNHAGLAWRWRSREDAQKYTSLPNDETMMVYSIVDEAGADGVWNRHIKHRLGMHEAVVKSCIKYLETKGYIVAMKNVEHPNKKMYIRANLRPSDRATGGPWFTDGELDSPFITELETIVFEYIKNHSAYLGSLPARGGGGAAGADGALKAPRKGIIRGGAAANGDARGLKRAATEISNDEQPAAAIGAPAAASSEAAEAKNSSSAASRAARGKVFLPFPAGYKSYPTVTEIAQFIHKTGITNNTTLGEADIQQLVDVLVYDGLVEAVKVGGRKGYRVMRAAKQDTASFEKRQKEREAGIGLDKPHTGVALPTNGVTEAPCGRCPVFEICEEGGPVSPSKCVYFMQWLGLEDRLAGGAPAMVSI
ncbi:RNA polymerase Rpc34 [Lasiosphaeria miniovina]|uniref:RNA polymerase Rpc34 n=1 Tax=Lasiosphaeria miniovina TaxID=1954250 RepID=A0AA40BIA7_9PEZI|nr:RNA polymerase Rpc34 [Lasiosphaeria miniovina]KAK0734732.1 RNA polymerase Rpc34 [Lasiosphaeria miniovina]